LTSFARRHVLVTGAGGFIGSHLVEELVHAGARVRALVRYTSRGDRGQLDLIDRDALDAVEVQLGDLRDVESVRAAVEGTEIVFNLGAQIAIPYSYVNPRDFFETNVLGAVNVAQAARDHGVARVVHV
jgi:nucleoside-diphosphate-sugar epimerase